MLRRHRGGCAGSGTEHRIDHRQRRHRGTSCGEVDGGARRGRHREVGSPVLRRRPAWATPCRTNQAVTRVWEVLLSATWIFVGQAPTTGSPSTAHADSWETRSRRAEPVRRVSDEEPMSLVRPERVEQSRTDEDTRADAVELTATDRPLQCNGVRRVGGRWSGRVRCRRRCSWTQRRVDRTPAAHDGRASVDNTPGEGPCAGAAAVHACSGSVTPPVDRLVACRSLRAHRMRAQRPTKHASNVRCFVEERVRARPAAARARPAPPRLSARRGRARRAAAGPGPRG